MLYSEGVNSAVNIEFTALFRFSFFAHKRYHRTAKFARKRNSESFSTAYSVPKIFFRHAETTLLSGFFFYGMPSRHSLRQFFIPICVILTLSSFASQNPPPFVNSSRGGFWSFLAERGLPLLLNFYGHLKISVLY